MNDIQPAIENGIADYIMMSGDKHVAFKLLPSMKMDEAGSRNHPGLSVHKQVADIVAGELKRILSV